MRNFKKKCLSVLLVISMTLGIVPPFKAITNAEEPTAVIYEPMSIDYAIFNADNMGNKDYYDIYAKQKQYYNSASKFSGFNPNAGYKGWQKEYRWDQFGYSIGEYNTMIFTPYGYMANAGHLQVCMGVTMKNDFHTHTKLGGLIEADSFVYAYTHLTWTVSKLSSPNTYDLILNGLKHMPEKSNPVRTGDMEYVPVSRQQNMRLSLGVGRTFAECDHIGASLRDFVVAFADTAGPSVLRVYPCDENERHSDLFKPGDTLYIKVEFNEALRFSDNQAAHGNITAKLIQEGSSGNYISGNLYKLKDNYLVFKFDNIDVSDFPLKDCTMTSIDISALFNDNGFPLNPIYGTRVANAEIDTTKFSGFGYTKAKSVVTDLAGNPIVNASVNKKPSLSSPCYIDGAGPYIYEVAKKGEMNNGDIKAGLTEPGTGLHASDIIAGVGDKITYRVYFNEKVNVNGQNLYSYSFYDMKATLNVKDGNGDYITLRSNAIMQVDWKLPNGISKGYVTEITFDPLVVQPGMVCDDEDGEIKIISVTPSDESVQITDLSGNMYDHTRNLEEVNKNPFILDIKPPETGTWLEDNGNVYTPVLDNGSVKQFYFPFTVTDESGTDDINGSFKWINGVNGTKNFNFEYAVTATATPPVESAGDGQGGSMDGRPVWRKGSMGQSYSFKQVSAGNFIHIRLIDGETYNIGFSSLEITGKDNAGNLATESFNLDYEVDLVAPEARIESVTKYRNISTSEGELRARVRVTDDNSGLSKVYYKWVPAGSERPSEDSEGWKATGSFAAGAGSAEVDANSDYITPNSKYSGDLYVKAVDMYNNTSVLFMGTYTYDLTAPEYTVEYSSEIAKEASLVISDLQDDSAAVFMVKKPGTENIYYVSVVDQVYEQGGDILNNLYYGYGNNRYENPLKDLYSWQKYRVIKREGAVDVYDFELLGFPDFSYYLSEDYVMSQILEGTYYGEIEITLLTGIVDKKASELDESMMDREYISETSFRYKNTLYDNGAFVYNLGPQFGVGYMTIIETAGTDTLPVFSETIVLNAAPAHPDVYQVAITTSDNILNKEGEGFDPDNSDTYMLSTLEGVNFNISIANKVVEDWGVKDVDFSNSYVTVYRVADIMGQYDNTQIGDKIYLEASGAVQNITLPAYDYPSGQYKLKLTVTSKTAGQQYEFEYPTNGKIYIDATGPSKEFGFAGFYSNISSIEFDVDDESYTFYGPVYNNNYSGEIPPGYMAKDNIIYIPATDDFNVSQTFYFSINDMLYDWNAKYGVRAMKVWNETEGVDAARSKELSEWKIINYAITGSLYSYPYAVQYVNDASRVLTSISRIFFR